MCVDLAKTLLAHAMVKQPMDNWLFHIVGFMIVPDPDIPGYQPPTYLQNLFVNVSDVSILYTPKYHPGSALLSVGSCSLSR